MGKAILMRPVQEPKPKADNAGGRLPEVKTGKPAKPARKLKRAGGR
jgi:hypothetical protein